MKILFSLLYNDSPILTTPAYCCFLNRIISYQAAEETIAELKRESDDKQVEMGNLLTEATKAHQETEEKRKVGVEGRLWGSGSGCGNGEELRVWQWGGVQGAKWGSQGVATGSECVWQLGGARSG